MVQRIYPTELRLNKANASDTEAAVLNLSINNDAVSAKLYDKWDDYDIVNFPFLDVDNRIMYMYIYIYIYV